MNATAQTVETLKSDGHFFAAGALAKQLGQRRDYGCHYGMRSDRPAATTQFLAGYDAAPATTR